jgi:hypothetical protein
VTTKALALRPKGKHPLHVLRELEIWPVTAEPVPRKLRARVLSGLPKLERAGTPAEAVPDKVLQEIFHTDESITAADVPRLCCGLPGVEGSALACRCEVVASANLPADLGHQDLLTAASAALDQAASARGAGWGESRGITLHLEVGSASLLRCGAMQLLVLHEKRGFAPGVREKLTLALGAVARSLRL